MINSSFSNIIFENVRCRKGNLYFKSNLYDCKDDVVLLLNNFYSLAVDVTSKIALPRHWKRGIVFLLECSQRHDVSCLFYYYNKKRRKIKKIFSYIFMVIILTRKHIRNGPFPSRQNIILIENKMKGKLKT